jgi:hypothetical protein
VQAHFEASRAEQTSVVILIVVAKVQVAIRPQALTHHQVMRLVARRGVLPMRRQRPTDEEDDGGSEPGAQYGVQGSGFKVQGSGFWFKGSRFWFTIPASLPQVPETLLSPRVCHTIQVHSQSSHRTERTICESFHLGILGCRKVPLLKSFVQMVQCFLQLAARHSKQPREISWPEPAEPLGDVARRRSGGPADLTAVIEISHRRFSRSNCKHSSLQSRASCQTMRS